MLGAIVGGGWGQVISQGTQFGLGTAFLRFSREYERQADIEGAQIMARAGYDPNDMANMFKTIEKQGGSGGPQWLSDHPGSGRSLRVHRARGAGAPRRQSDPQHAGVRAGAVAPQAAVAGADDRAGDEERDAGRHHPGSGRGLPSGRVEAPSASFQTYTEGNMFRISVPSNWRELPGGSAVTFAPEGAYGDANGQSMFTHGVEVGAARNESHDLQTATQRADRVAGPGNPGLSRPSRFDRVKVGGRQGLRAVMTNTSSSGEPENIVIFTSQLRDGSLFYAVAVAPRHDFLRPISRRVFDKVRFPASIQLID